MKKLTSLLLAVVMVVLLVGCMGGSVEISRGTTSGDTYRSETLNLQFTKPASWVYATDEEIAAAVNVGADLLDNEDLKTALENNPAIYDMLVKDLSTGTNVMIGYENLAKTLSSNITEKQYLDAVKEQFGAVSSVKVTFSETYDTVKLGKTDFLRVVCNTTASGVSMQQVYYVHKMDGYMGLVIVTIPKGYTVAQIEAMFK